MITFIKVVSFKVDSAAFVVRLPVNRFMNTLLYCIQHHRRMRAGLSKILLRLDYQ